jgi:hypothetical protein
MGSRRDHLAGREWGTLPRSSNLGKHIQFRGLLAPEEAGGGGIAGEREMAPGAVLWGGQKLPAGWRRFPDWGEAPDNRAEIDVQSPKR